VTNSNLAPGTDEKAPAASEATGRQFFEPMRELTALALLGGNAIFLLFAFFDLIFVIDGWASGFGVRSEITFGTFIGFLSITLPLLAVILGVFMRPEVPRAKLIVTAALIEYAVSAFFGVITFIAAFAHEVGPASIYGGGGDTRHALESAVQRLVWIGFFALAALLVYRIWRARYYTPRPKPAYPGYGQYGQPGQPTYQSGQSGHQQYAPGRVSTGGQPSYGQPYPGYPSPPPMPPATPPAAPPGPPANPAGEAGWPAVPPPPMPNPPSVGQPAPDPTTPMTNPADPTRPMQVPEPGDDTPTAGA
jgi:hypothetical protein